MISYEERREVAARLREMARQYGDGWGVVRCGDLPAPVDDAMFMCNIGRVICASELFNRLADLIEPEPERICRNKVIKNNKEFPPEHRTDNFICSACGAHFFADSEYINHPIDWAFCPDCGAKVVD